MHDGASGTNRNDKHRQSVVTVLNLEKVQLQVESEEFCKLERGRQYGQSETPVT